MYEEVIQDFQCSPHRFGTFIGALFPTQPSVLGAEIGVHQGIHSLKMLKSHHGLKLVGVDLWELHSRLQTSYLESPGTLPERFKDERQALLWRQEAERALTLYGPRSELFCESSVDNSCRWPEGFFDFVYIDADHSYEACIMDIRMWWPKIRQGGIMAGHDYGEFGVPQALDEAFPGGVYANRGAKGRCWMIEKFD
jgi:hypothetical protein